MTVTLDYYEVFRRLAIDVDLDYSSTQYCLRRLKAEGVQFLTITLPQLTRSVLSSLEIGVFVRPTSFAWKGRSLRYFRSLLDGIFDRDGKVRHDSDPLSLWRLRQLCDYFYKLALPFSEEVLDSSCLEFETIDTELANVAAAAPIRLLKKNFETYYAALSTATLDTFVKSVRPRYGPGTFAGHTKSREPYYCQKLQTNNVWGYLGRYEGFSGFFKPYISAPKNFLIRLQADTSQSSELLLVPKDSRGPRTIVREPLHLLKLQLGFFDWITPLLEDITYQRVNFHDQSVNRRLACDSSKRPSLYSTIDLKSGSDRVSYSLMKKLFANSPLLRFMLEQRSTVVRLPNGKLHRMNKVAGMGSGLTFPLMALLIHLTICTEISQRTASTFRDAMSTVYVYGDDVIVRSEHFNLAKVALTRVGLEVNLQKSFRYSSFRESCGGDYYKGQDVAPVRLKLASCEPKVLTGMCLELSKRSEALNQLHSHLKTLTKNGLMALRSYFLKKLEAHLGPLPATTGDSPVIGNWSSYIQPSLDVDAFGTHQLRMVYTILPQVQAASVDPYWYLASKLLPDPVGFNPLSEFAEESLPYGIVSVPRSVRVARRPVSTFVFAGP